MLQTLATLGSLILSVGAMGIIAQSLVEDQAAFRAALLGARRTRAALPARTQRVAAPRASRFIRLETAPQEQRAVA